MAASAAAKLGGEDSYAYLVSRFQRGGEREKRFYAALIAQADPKKADAVFRAALAEAKDEALIAALCSVLAADSDENTAAVREIALGGFGAEARLGAVRFLGRRASADALDTLELVVRSGGPSSVRAAALVELIRARPKRNPAVKLAAEWLNSAEPELRVAAAEALAASASPEAKLLIPVARKDGDKRVRAIAVRALGAMTGDKQAELVLIEVLEEGADGTAIDAIRSLGRLRSEEAVATLSRLAGDGELSGQVAAVEALGQIRTADAISSVESAFQQADVCRVRAAAALALGATGNAAYVPRLAEALKAAPGLDVRAACAQALGRLGGEAAGTALAGALEQDSALVREAVVRALAEHKVPRPPDVFKRMLNDSDVRVADAARQALSAPPKGK